MVVENVPKVENCIKHTTFTDALRLWCIRIAGQIVSLSSAHIIYSNYTKV